jgi:hypothetical protein
MRSASNSKIHKETGYEMKAISVAAGLAAAFILTACGGSASSPSVADSGAPATLTASESASICNDVNAWLKAASNEDMPRLNATLLADESRAAGTQLGDDLASFGNDLSQMNSAAFDYGPPGDPQPVQAVVADCADHGVTISVP